MQKIDGRQVEDGGIMDEDISPLAQINVDKVAIPPGLNRQTFDFNTIASTSTLTARRIYMQPLYLNNPLICNNVVFNLKRARSSGRISVALYDKNGYLVLSTTPVIPSVGNNYMPIDSIKIRPGQYYVALLTTGGHEIFTGTYINNAPVPRQGILAGTGHATLPENIAPSSDIIETSDQQPWIAFTAEVI